MRLSRGRKPFLLDGQEQMSMRHKPMIFNPMLVDEGLPSLSLLPSQKESVKRISRFRCWLKAKLLAFYS